MTDPLLTLGGLATATRVPAPTIRSWANKGLIPHELDSIGRRLFHQDAIAIALRVRGASWHERRMLRHSPGTIV